MARYDDDAQKLATMVETIRPVDCQTCADLEECTVARDGGVCPADLRIEAIWRGFEISWNGAPEEHIRAYQGWA